MTIHLSKDKVDMLREYGINNPNPSLWIKKFKTRDENGNISLRVGNEITNSPLQKGIPTYSLEEVLNLLPDTIYKGRFKLDIHKLAVGDKKWFIGYVERDEDRCPLSGMYWHTDSLIEGAFALLINGMDKKYID